MERYNLYSGKSGNSPAGLHAQSIKLYKVEPTQRKIILPHKFIRFLYKLTPLCSPSPALQNQLNSNRHSIMGVLIP